MDGAPDTEQIRAILAPLGLTLRSVRRPKSGLTGSVFILTTVPGASVLKVSDDPASDWKLAKERIVYGLLRERGIPTPSVLVTDLSRNLVPFAYTLSEHLPGLTFSQAYAGMSVAERLGIYSQLGDLLGRMHSLTFGLFGDVTEEDGKVTVGAAREIACDSNEADSGPFTAWREMHRQVVSGRLSFLSRTEFHDLTAAIARWFSDHEGLLDYPVTPRLLHVDLHMSNILVSEGKVSGILDVEEAVIGHNEYDLMRTELAHFGDGYEEFQKAFFKGYAAHVTLDAGYEDRRPFYELSRSLVGLKCLVLYRERAATELAEETRRARTRIREIMD